MKRQRKAPGAETYQPIQVTGASPDTVLIKVVSNSETAGKFLRSQAKQLLRAGKALSKSTRMAPEVRRVAQQCVESAQCVIDHLKSEMLSGDRIDAAMLAAYSQGID
jgi:hypothetical protein